MNELMHNFFAHPDAQRSFNSSRDALIRDKGKC